MKVGNRLGVLFIFFYTFHEMPSGVRILANAHAGLTAPTECKSLILFSAKKEKKEENMTENTREIFFSPTHHMLGIKDAQGRGCTKKPVAALQLPASARLLLAHAFLICSH